MHKNKTIQWRSYRNREKHIRNAIKSVGTRHDAFLVNINQIDSILPNLITVS